MLFDYFLNCVILTVRLYINDFRLYINVSSILKISFTISIFIDAI